LNTHAWTAGLFDTVLAPDTFTTYDAPSGIDKPVPMLESDPKATSLFCGMGTETDPPPPLELDRGWG
jgi:hypothetical protein